MRYRSKKLQLPMAYMSRFQPARDRCQALLAIDFGLMQHLVILVALDQRIKLLLANGTNELGTDPLITGAIFGMRRMRTDHHLYLACGEA